jgi:hypothetical protein
MTIKLNSFGSQLKLTDQNRNLYKKILTMLRATIDTGSKQANRVAGVPTVRGGEKLMKQQRIFFLAICLLFTFGCSIVRFTPDTQPFDPELISALSEVSIKVVPIKDNDTKREFGYGYQVYNSQLFKKVIWDDQPADLVITELYGSNHKCECGFFNEAIVYMTFIGYVGVCDCNYIFYFKLESAKAKESLTFGPLEYKKEIFSGWFFAPIGLFKGWKIHRNTSSISGTRDLWLSILNSKREDVLRLIEKGKKIITDSGSQKSPHINPQAGPHRAVH